MAGRRIAEKLRDWSLEEMMSAHTLGRSFFMRPQKLPKKSDRTYDSNSDFWTDVWSERVSVERSIMLNRFRIFDWFPRNPGLYHTGGAQGARAEAQYNMRRIGPVEYDNYLHLDGAPPDHAEDLIRTSTEATGRARELVFTPIGKLSMLNGGIGCVRYKPLGLATGETAWLMSATSTFSPDEGVPLFVPNVIYQKIIDEIHDSGFATVDVFGVLKYIPDAYRDLYSVNNGISRLYIEVDNIKAVRNLDPGRGLVSVAASFLSSFEGRPQIYATYATFNPSAIGARNEAAKWLEQEYVAGLYNGKVLTDFDQRAPLFSDALFTLNDVLMSPDLAEKVDALSRAYGNFDWRELDRFNYIEHKGDLIVTTENYTVTNSQNVVIKSSLTNSNLTVEKIQSASGDQKEQLNSLVKQLIAALAKAPEDRKEEVEAIDFQAKATLDEAAKPKPNKAILKTTASGLQSAASFLKDAVPAVGTIAGEIIKLIGEIHGIFAAALITPTS